MSLAVVFENNEIVIINKPVGLSSDLDAVSPQSVIQLAQKNFGEEYRLVHRLDKETSGLLILAKNKASATRYMGYFEARKVIKRYHAVLCGSLKEDSGTWQQPLSEKAEGRNNPQGDSDLLDSRTDYLCIKRGKFFTLVEFDLKTGRTHQIRRHSVLNRHAIFGDTRYGNQKYFEKMYTVYGVTRMCLQSSFIEFPDEGIRVQLNVPEEFLKFVEPT